MGRMEKYVLIALFFCICGLGVSGQNPKQNDGAWKTFLDLDKYLAPFWATDTVHGELILAIGDRERPSAGLLYQARKILSVRDAGLSKAYIKGKDWIYKNGRMTIPERSLAPYFQKDELLFNVEKKGASLPGKNPHEFVLHNERGALQAKQLAVTYIKKSGAHWNGPLPEFAEDQLPQSLAKLRKGERFKIVFYGNSIETGANSSGFMNIPPFLPTWPEMIVYQLRKKYGSFITYANRSAGGKLALWGKDNCAALVIPEQPDLVVIGFGMNDGTQRIDPVEYASNIRSIIDQVQQRDKKCEFIVVSPMLANPKSRHDQKQPLYKYELYKFKSTGIAVADMTAVHQELLKHKSYQDMTGNNINHPNDYLARWYAMFVNGLLIPK
jgi:lysophospholipase L1-like esterase